MESSTRFPYLVQNEFSQLQVVELGDVVQGGFLALDGRHGDVTLLAEDSWLHALGDHRRQISPAMVKDVVQDVHVVFGMPQLRQTVFVSKHIEKF